MRIIDEGLRSLIYASMSVAVLWASTALAGDNLITKPSKYSVPDTINRIEQAVTAKGMTIFARIDHAGEAKKAGLEMKPMELLIFGNPKGGTPLMVAKPTSAIDLPMKALAWEDKDGKVWLTYNASKLLQERHGLSPDLAARLDPVGKVLEQTAE